MNTFLDDLNAATAGTQDVAVEDDDSMSLFLVGVELTTWLYNVTAFVVDP